MSISTFRKLIHVSSIGFFAIATCLLTAESVHAQSPLDINLIESAIIPPPPEVGVSQLPGFSWTQQWELVLTGNTTDPNPKSDDIFLYNAGATRGNPGTATVVFLSDDENGNLPLFPAALPPIVGPITGLVMPEPGPVSIAGLALMNNGTGISFLVRNQFFSDVDNGAFNGISDFAHFQIPEPTSFYMAAMALASLTAIAYRRRRWARIR